MKHTKLLSSLTALFLTASAIPCRGMTVRSGSNIKGASDIESNKFIMTAAAGNVSAYTAQDLHILQDFL